METLDKESAKKILNSRVGVYTPDRYTVKVTSVTTFEGKHIINTNAVNAYQQKEAMRLYKEGDYNSACNQNLSASILPGMYLPAKGDYVHIMVGEVTTKSGETALLIKNVSAIPAKEAAKIAWNFDEEPEEEVDDVELDDLEEVEEEPLPPVVINKKQTTTAPPAKTQPKRK